MIIRQDIFKIITNIQYDFHFLVDDSLENMNWFDIMECNQVSFHFEHNTNIQGCIDYLMRLGARKFIAINPEADIHVLDEYLPQLDGVLIMHTPPGFTGKKLIPTTINKVKDLRKYLNELDLNLDIESDGNVSVENAKKLYESGANIFVAGTSSLFMQTEKSMKDIIEEKRKVIGWK